MCAPLPKRGQNYRYEIPIKHTCSLTGHGVLVSNLQRWCRVFTSCYPAGGACGAEVKFAGLIHGFRHGQPGILAVRLDGTLWSTIFILRLFLLLVPFLWFLLFTLVLFLPTFSCWLLLVYLSAVLIDFKTSWNSPLCDIEISCSTLHVFFLLIWKLHYRFSFISVKKYKLLTWPQSASNSNDDWYFLNWECGRNVLVVFC